ncbi:MAG TPA: DNA-3-methyladenine glycosylase [Clostridia bacterium]
MQNYQRLDESFYLQDTLTVAKQLLGKRFVRKIGDKVLSGMIVETEAYIGAIDEASHSHRGMTERNKIMWERGGFLYVYQIYGMYYCMNVVTEKEGTAAAVLIRAIEPLENIEIMANNRHIDLCVKSKKFLITSGPGRACQAFDIKKLHNGTDLINDENITITEYKDYSLSDIVVTPRINIDYAPSAVDFPWRFFIKDNPYVSRHKNNSRILT